MTRQEISEKLAQAFTSIGIPFDSDHPDHITSESIDDVSLPIVTWTVSDVTFYADDLPYCVYHSVQVRYFNETDDMAVEKYYSPVDEAVRSAVGSFRKSLPVFDAENGWYTTTYTSEVI